MEITSEYINSLIDKYSDTALRIALMYLKSKEDAEDVVQEVFLKIIDKKPEFNDERHAKYWITKTAANLSKNRLSLFWNRNKRSIDDAYDIASYDTYNTDTEVIRAVWSLPEKYKLSIYLFYYEGYSTKEIAEITKQKEATVRSLLHRARTKLKDMLKEEYGFE